MIIAHLTKPWLPIPPKGYGGIERIVHFLIQEQSEQNSLFLFAPGTSQVDCKANVCSLFQDGQQGKGLDRNIELAQAFHCVKKCFELKADVIHAHSVDPILAFMDFVKIPCVFTFHSRPTQEGKVIASLSSSPICYTFLSEYHRKQYPWIKMGKIIHPGINLKSHEFHNVKQGYLAYVGRICEQKGVLDAIQIARLADIPIKIAGISREVDGAYFQTVLGAINDYSGAEFVGEVDDEERNRLVGNAMGLLFPIKSGEAFGLIQIEAMALGTPVITYDVGAAYEIVIHNKTGFIVQNIYEAADAVRRLNCLKPIDCRLHIEEKFSSERMANDFLQVYSSI